MFGNERDVSRPAPLFHRDDLVDFEAVVSALAAAATVSFKGCDEQVVCDAALQLERARRFLDATESHALAELEARSVTDRAFGLRTGPWLAELAGLPSGVAKARVKTAKSLATLLPEVDKALTAGDIGFDHAKAFADATNPRNVDEMAGVSGELCDEAKNMMFLAWRRQVDQMAELFDEDGGYDPDADLARNRLRLSPTGDTLSLKGELVGENSLITKQALNAIADELFDKYARDREACPELKIPSRPTLLALALVEACRRGLATPLDSTKPGRPEASIILTPHPNYPTSPGGAWDGEPGPGHSTCQGKSEHGCCQSKPGPECGTGEFGAPAGLPWNRMFHHGRQWAPLRDFAGMSVYGESGQPLHQRTWRTLLCDPDMYATIVNSLGVPLDMGRKIRFASRAQRRALALRDGGCTFPGCSAPASWTEAHHSKHWEHGGKTDIGDLASLCRHHHGVAHRRGWNVIVEADGWTNWTSPEGRQFPGQQHQQQKRPPPPT